MTIFMIETTLLDVCHFNFDDSKVILSFLTNCIHYDWFLLDFCFILPKTEGKKNFHMGAFRF